MDRAEHFLTPDSRGFTRSDQRYRLNIMGRVEIVLPRLSGIAKKNCRVLDISVEGAGLIFEETIGLPSHFYLTIDNYFERLGCAEVNRVESQTYHRIGIRFLRLLDERWLISKLMETNCHLQLMA